MTLKFHAAAIHIEETPEHVLLGLADDPSSPDDYVVLMRGRKGGSGVPGEVVDGVYLEYGGETMAGHGCLASVTLHPDRLVLRIDRKRCKLIPHAELVVTFDPAYETAHRLPGLLRQLIGDTAPLRILAGE